MKYLLNILLGLTCGAMAVALWQADEVVTQLEYDLNVSNTAIMVYKSENKRLQEKNVGLRKANSCLMTNGKNCSKGILATPLPKLVKETK